MIEGRVDIKRATNDAIFYHVCLWFVEMCHISIKFVSILYFSKVINYSDSVYLLV